MIAVRNGSKARARLVALGAHAPERVVTNAEIETWVDTTDEWIMSRTGIRERRFVAEDEAASDLGVIAAERILEDAGLAAADVDVLIVPTASPDHIFPSTAALVADRIGAHKAAAFDLNAGCTGFVYALAQACGLVESGIGRNVLVVGAEALSRLMDTSDRGTCILFGDAAAGALVVADDDEEGTTGFLGFELGADGSGGPDLVVPAGGSRQPLAAVDAPGDACIQMNGREVFKFATRVMVDSCTRLLEAVEMKIDEVDLLIAHQANSRIIDHAVPKLGIDPDKVLNNLDRYGNTSSASIPLVLTEARDAGRLESGHLMLLVAFGAGLTWGSTLVRYEPS
ncbi:MAG: beta-ketoacyl-ACP synthase III [Miltoncostaeaceae bacterium]